MENSTPNETQVPVEVVASSTPETMTVPAASAPEAVAAPVVAATPSPTPVPVVPVVKMELPKTTGQTVGGWNRFAGYNPNAAKSKQKDGQRGSKGR